MVFSFPRGGAGLGVSLVALFLLSSFLTGRYIAYARKKQILDIPNERSSHSIPTPRGGGVVFVSLLLLLFTLFVFILPQERPLWLSLLFGGAAVALIGWIDDKGGVSPKVRLAVHAVAVAWTLFQMGGLPSLSLGCVSLPLGKLGSCLALIGGIWAINLYNFMDGIDGLAAGQAIIASLSAVFLLKGANSTIALALLVTAAAVLGFLFWNRPPARVFMGDAGSGFLGFVFFSFLLRTERGGEMPALLWLVILSVFIIDATLTLLLRFWEGKKLSQPHRDHLYQKFIITGCSHGSVTIGALSLSLCVSLFAYTLIKQIFLLFLVVYSFLVIAWLQWCKKTKRRAVGINIIS
ncbi:MraY family glycosyltransferase [Aminobacterium colombiense]